MTPLETLSVRLQDARRLLEIHEATTGAAAGRRRNVDVLNRSALLLTVAAWEGFCEDSISVSAARISRQLQNKDLLPESVIRPFMYWFYEDSQLRSVSDISKSNIWSIAGDGWRSQYRKYSERKVDDLNTPNFMRLKKLASQTIGISDLGANWTYGRYDQSFYVSKLEDTLQIRHQIAHGRRGNTTVGKIRAKDSITLIERLAGWVSESIYNNETNLGVVAQYMRY